MFANNFAAAPQLEYEEYKRKRSKRNVCIDAIKFLLIIIFIVLFSNLCMRVKNINDILKHMPDILRHINATKIN